VHVAHRHPDLLHHLAPRGLLDALALLDKPGEARVHSAGALGAAAQQRAAAIRGLDQRDDYRVGARIEPVLRARVAARFVDGDALAAAARAGFGRHRRRAAARAVAVRLVPRA
jgi:hypothetical protein